MKPSEIEEAKSVYLQSGFQNSFLFVVIFSFVLFFSVKIFDFPAKDNGYGHI